MLSECKVIKINNPSQIWESARGLKNFIFLAGGTDLIVQIKEKNIAPDVIIDISELSEFQGIKENKNNVCIGALTKISSIEDSKLIKKHAPLLAGACQSIGSIQIRNIASIGGNIANASPVGDTLPPLYALEAKLILTDGKNKRTISIDKFITGYRKTALKKGEIIKDIIIPKEKGCFHFFKKIGQRKSFIISKVSLALCGYKKEGITKYIRIALGSVGAKIIRAKRTEGFLVEKILNEDLIQKASSLVLKEIKPITDIRSTVEYRNKIAQEFLKEALIEFKKHNG